LFRSKGYRSAFIVTVAWGDIDNDTIEKAEKGPVLFFAKWLLKDLITLVSEKIKRKRDSPRQGELVLIHR